MKKTILMLLAGITAAAVQAQTLRLGLKGGINVANEKIKSESFSYKDESIASVHVGFIADLALSEHLSAQPQLLLSGKGSRFDNLVYRPFYLELPVNFIYKGRVSDNIELYGGLGPGIGIGLFGKLTDDNGNFSRNLRFGETINSDYKTADFTGGFEIGAEVNKRLAFGIGYRWSFLDVTRGSNKVTHKVVNFSLAYFFQRSSGEPRKPSGRSSSGVRSSSRRN